jgi:phosphoserine aminotransferase
MIKTNRPYNFAAGPAQLPLEVLLQIKEDLPNWITGGVSAFEIGHRTSEFTYLLTNLQEKLRNLLNIPQEYSILFLQGGAQTCFSSIPLNLCNNNKDVDYLVTGLWSQRAAKFASRYVNVNIVNPQLQYSVAPISSWKLNAKARYFYYCDNETINGISLPNLQLKTNIPIVVDATSSILLHPLNVSKYGIIFASAQKNLGIAGITLMIIHNELLDQAMDITPDILNFQNQVINNSVANTIPTVSIYIMDLVVDWIIKRGGLQFINQEQQHKANKLYQYIDTSDFYSNSIDKSYRSYINIPFNLMNPKLNHQFLSTANKNGLRYLQGHKLAGGMRASLYISMPKSGVDALIDFMQHFKSKYS